MNPGNKSRGSGLIKVRHGKKVSNIRMHYQLAITIGNCFLSFMEAYFKTTSLGSERRKNFLPSPVLHQPIVHLI